MKKSKIIIPALGVLLLSTAASVTGTVAWFTTVSSATANITSFAVRKLGGDLSYTVAAGTGTEKVDSTDTSAIRLTGTNAAMCDASYNHTQGYVWKANSNASQFTQITTEDDWDVTSVTPAQVTYYAVSWTYTFTYAFGGDSTAMNLYFDSPSSSITPTQTAANTLTGANASLATYKGFRIAFINESASRTLVWAGAQESSNCHYVTAANASAGTYASGTLIDSAGLAIPEETATAATSRGDYLGQFTTSSATVTIKCVAWFEGTDPNVVNGSEMDSVAAALGFYTRPNA